MRLRIRIPPIRVDGRIALIVATAIVASAGVFFSFVLGDGTGREPSASPSTRPSSSSSPAPTPTTLGPTPSAQVANTSRCRRVSGIAADGRRDVTASLQRFLASVPNRSCVVFPASGPGGQTTYRVDGAVQIVERVGLRIYGNGALLTTSVRGGIDNSAKGGGRSQRAMIQVIRGRDIQIWDLRFDGPNTDGHFDAPYEEESAIRLSGVNGARIQGVQVREVHGDAITVMGNKPGGGVVIPSRRVVISRLDAQLIGRQGIGITGADGVTIEDSSFNEIERTVVDLEPLPRQSARNVRIVRNTVGQHNHYFVGGGGFGPKGNVYVGHNTLTVPLKIKFFDGSNFTIEHNIGSGVSEHPILIASGSNLRVIGNVQSFSGRGVKCPPNCGTAAMELTTGSGSMCRAFAAGNTFRGARLLYQGDRPRSSCAWVDGGRNVLASGAPPSASQS